MRLLRLDLLAYGPFTDRSLPLDEGRFGLHLVFGPNEAGKSSALRALRCLFYGIPTQCPDAFVHPYPQLRIGAVVQDEQGEPLHVIRRKGVKDTLRGEDDTAVIDPAQLARLLGGIDETQFRLRFGIDHQELVRGGDDLVHGGGELGHALFAAGAGLSDLGTVQAKLSEDAERLFQARGSLPRINKTLAELDAARKLRKESQLRPAEWTQQMDQLRAAQQEKASVDTRLAETRTQRQRWERVRQALPLAAKRQRLEAELTEVGETPRLTDDFPEKRRDGAVGTGPRQTDAAGNLDGLEPSRRGPAESGRLGRRARQRSADSAVEPGLGGLPESGPGSAAASSASGTRPRRRRWPSSANWDATSAWTRLPPCNSAVPNGPASGI